MTMSTHFSFEQLVSLLGRSENDPAVRNFFGHEISNIDRDEYYGSLEFKPEGVDVVFLEAPWVVPSEEITDPKVLYIAHPKSQRPITHIMYSHHNQAVGPIFRPACLAFGKNRTRSLHHECKYIAALSHATDSNTLSIAIRLKQLSCHQSMALTMSK
jgi:hypothetical protein